MDTELIITFDPAADAVYVQVADSEAGAGPGETVVDDSGVIIDTDSYGNPRGFEFLSVSLHRMPLDGLPSDVANALQRFLAAGSLESTMPVKTEYP